MRRIDSLRIVQVLELGVVVAGAPWSVSIADDGPPIPSQPQIYAPVGATGPRAHGSNLVFGIVPVDSGASPQRAAALAKFASALFRKRHIRRVQVFVFADLATGKAFSKYQFRRRSAPLAARDYAALKKLWPRTLAFYERANGRERVFYPSRAAQGWWKPLVARPRR